MGFLDKLRGKKNEADAEVAEATAVEETVAAETSDASVEKKSFWKRVREGLSKTKNAIFGQIDDLLKNFVRVDEDLLEELETEFGIDTYPITWPIGCGLRFKGVYHREHKTIISYADSHRGRERLSSIDCAITDTEKALTTPAPVKNLYKISSRDTIKERSTITMH